MATVITTDFSCRAHVNKLSCYRGLPTNDPSSCNYFFFCPSLGAPISLSYQPSDNNYLIPRVLVEVVALLFAIDIGNVKKQKRPIRCYAIEAAQRWESIPLLTERRDFNRCVVAIYSITYQNFHGKRHFIVSTKELGQVKRNHRGETNK